VNKLLNMVLMQLSWFACVLGAAHHVGWIGAGSAVLISSWHVWRASQRRIEVMLLLTALVLGLVIDSSLASGGLLKFTSGVLVPGFTTLWMLGLWLGFATTLNSSLQWLMTRPLVAIMFGAMGGPAAYWSGVKLGALSLGPVTLSLVAISVCWAIAMACFVLVIKRFDNRDTQVLT
jgi:hypothetical protein